MSVWPAWEVRDAGGTTSWFHVRLGFVDGARVELLAVVCEGRVSVEDVRAQPPLSLVDLTVLADWIEGPLFERCDQGGALEAAGVEGAGDAADTDSGYDGCGVEGPEEAGRRRGCRRDVRPPAGPSGLAARHRGAVAGGAGVPRGPGGGGGPRPRGHVRHGTQPPQIAQADRAGA